MPSPTNTTSATDDTHTRETAERARGAATRVERETERAEEIASLALRDLMQAWTDGVRLFVPPALLQPEAAVRIVATITESIVELQRRFLDELLTAGRDAVVATDLQPLHVEVRSRGVRSSRAVA